MVPLVIGGVAAFGIWRMNKAKNAVISDEECVACDSKNVTILGEGTYHCNDCGYEGGSGVAKMQEDAHRATIAAMSDEDKKESGIKDLLEARTLLKAAQGTLSHVGTLSVIDIAGSGGMGDRGNAKQQDLVSAVGELMRAQAHIRDASLKLGDNNTYDFDIEFDPTVFALDVAFDSMIAGIMVHAQIMTVQKHCQSMLVGVEGALEKVRLADQGS